MTTFSPKKCEHAHTKGRKKVYRVAVYSVYHPNMGTKYSCSLHLSMTVREIAKGINDKSDAYVHVSLIPILDDDGYIIGRRM